MICPNCGNQLPDGAQFCNSCGQKLTYSAPAPAPAPVAAAGGNGKGMSIAAMVCGIVGIIVAMLINGIIGLIISIVAIVLGKIGLNKNPTGTPGHGMAMAGFVLGIASVAISVVAIIAVAACLGAIGAAASSF